MVEITGLKEQPVRTEFYPERGRRGLDGGQLTDFGGIGARPMKEAASIGGLNTPTLLNYLPRAKLSFCVTSAITEKPRAIAIVTVQKVSHMG
jgi:hypothetical protein